MPVLRGRLKGSVTSKDSINIAFLSSQQFLHFLCVTISGRFDELLRQIPGYVSFKQLFEQG